MTSSAILNPLFLSVGTVFSTLRSPARCGDPGTRPWSGPVHTVTGPLSEPRLLELEFEWNSSHLLPRRYSTDTSRSCSGIQAALGRSSVISEYFIVLLAQHSSSQNFVALRIFRINFQCTVLSRLLPRLNRFLDRVVFRKIQLRMTSSGPLPSLNSLFDLPQFEEAIFSGFGVWDDSRLIASVPAITATPQDRTFSLITLIRNFWRHLATKFSF